MPELIESERRLQCYVEGIERDKILVRFTHIDKGDLNREFSVVIDVSGSAYRGKCSRCTVNILSDAAF